MTTTPTVYTDDTDASWVFTIPPDPAVDNPPNLDWANPKVAAGAGTYTLTATWLGDPAPTRKLKVTLTGLAAGKTYTLYLQVPGGVDFKLGNVRVADRS